MGLGSEDNKTRKDFRQTVSEGKNNWKNSVNTVAEAQKILTVIHNNLAADPNGEYIMCAYIGTKIKLLKAYIANGKDIPIKTFKP